MTSASYTGNDSRTSSRGGHDAEGPTAALALVALMGQNGQLVIERN
jgi:hypothetical protein